MLNKFMPGVVGICSNYTTNLIYLMYLYNTHTHIRIVEKCYYYYKLFQEVSLY